VLSAGPATAQFVNNPYPAPRPYSDVIPSVAPYGQNQGMQAEQLPPPSVMMPPGRPAAAVNPTSLDRVTTPIQRVSGEDSNPYTTLTGQPLQPPQQMMGVPKGSYPAPTDTDMPGCCGPLGHDGRIGEEVYTDTGPTIPFGNGQFIHRLELGWMVGAGGRVLFFNQAHDAAWVSDLGWSYQYNRGNQWSPMMLDVRQPNTTNATTGAIEKQPDVLTNVFVRDIDRTTFNFAIGRDWWFWGPGATGAEKDWNLRIGGLVGGRWGTAHVDLIPVADIHGYFRRQNAITGVFVELHSNLEVPLGSVIFFAGVQVQYGYDWTNLAPPVPGDISSINVLLTTGFRF
jgi:hypothetical protein